MNSINANERIRECTKRTIKYGIANLNLEIEKVAKTQARDWFNQFDIKQNQSSTNLFENKHEEYRTKLIREAVETFEAELLK